MKNIQNLPCKELVNIVTRKYSGEKAELLTSLDAYPAFSFRDYVNNFIDPYFRYSKEQLVCLEESYMNEIAYLETLIY